jgi:hypothetical protein
MLPTMMAEYGCKTESDLRKKFEATHNRRLVIVDTHKKAERIASRMGVLYYTLFILYSPIYLAVVITKIVTYIWLAFLALLSWDLGRFKRMIRHLTHTNPFSHGY